MLDHRKDTGRLFEKWIDMILLPHMSGLKTASITKEQNPFCCLKSFNKLPELQIAAVDKSGGL